MSAKTRLIVKAIERLTGTATKSRAISQATRAAEQELAQERAMATVRTALDRSRQRSSASASRLEALKRIEAEKARLLEVTQGKVKRDLFSDRGVSLGEVLRSHQIDGPAMVAKRLTENFKGTKIGNGIVEEIRVPQWAGGPSTDLETVPIEVVIRRPSGKVSVKGGLMDARRKKIQVSNYGPDTSGSVRQVLKGPKTQLTVPMDLVDDVSIPTWSNVRLNALDELKQAATRIDPTLRTAVENAQSIEEIEGLFRKRASSGAAKARSARDELRKAIEQARNTIGSQPAAPVDEAADTLLGRMGQRASGARAGAAERKVARLQSKYDELSSLEETVNALKDDKTQHSFSIPGLGKVKTTKEKLSKVLAAQKAKIQGQMDEVGARAESLRAAAGPGRQSTRGILDVVRGVEPVTGTTWAQRNKLKASLAAGVGATASFVVPEFLKGLEERRASSSPEMLAVLRRQMERQATEQMRYVAAVQRLQSGGRENLAILAARQPHVFQELMAGRKLAPGVVTVGGNKADRMERLAMAGVAMGAGDVGRMAPPDAMAMLAQSMGQ